LPATGSHRQPAYRKAIQRALFDVDPKSSVQGAAGSASAITVEGSVADRGVAQQVEELRDRMRAHPVHKDPALPEIEVWARRHDELRDRTDRLEHTLRRRTRSLVTRFSAIVDLLQHLGYLDEEPTPTAEGLVLSGLYADSDLVLAECLRWGIFDDLDPAELAALASVFTFESRAPEQQVVRIPTTRLQDAVDAVESHLARIAALETEHGMPSTRDLDAGFMEVVHRWASGADLERALGTSELTPGDFVRSVKMVADMVRQIRDSSDGPVRGTARAANQLLVRGVVEY
jgi:ATP-dependent RNA helicase HelY